MILVHRLRGEPVFINADLIESIEGTPDTIITMIDGRRLVVAEDAETLVDRVIRFRAALLVAVDELRSSDRSRLSLVPDLDDGPESHPDAP